MMPDVCSGSMPQVTPFHCGVPAASAYRQAKPMATSHSTSDEVWMIHVGTESALAGSVAHTPCGRLPTPPSQAVCTSAPPGATTATADSAAAARSRRARARRRPGRRRRRSAA
uniref:Uncharacterized protein n=1 Tax=Phaeocystis antarctica TaxID=33657 RepID=A0A7S0E1F5_9EUKA